MKNAIAVLVTSIFLGPLVARAAEQQDHAAHHPPASQGTLDMTEGEVRRIDKSAAKITLKHDEIRHLEMPPMTMVFQVREASLLDKIQVGGKVRFRAEKVGGAYIVTAIEVLR